MNLFKKYFDAILRSQGLYEPYEDLKQAQKLLGDCEVAREAQDLEEDTCVVIDAEFEKKLIEEKNITHYTCKEINDKGIENVFQEIDSLIKDKKIHYWLWRIGILHFS